MTNQESPIKVVDMSTKIDNMEFTVRTRNCLLSENITILKDLLSKTPRDLLKIPNFGKKSLREVCEVLGNLGYPTPYMDETFDSYIPEANPPIEPPEEKKPTISVLPQTIQCELDEKSIIQIKKAIEHNVGTILKQVLEINRQQDFEVKKQDLMLKYHEEALRQYLKDEAAWAFNHHTMRLKKLREAFISVLESMDRI